MHTFEAKQIIFIEIDAVLGSVLTGLLGRELGKLDVLHQLRESPGQTDLALLMSTTRRWVSTCWKQERLNAVLPEYLEARGWKPSDVRIYVLGHRLA